MKKNKIAFIHKGYSSYLIYSLDQAHYTNPDAELILLGDENNRKICKKYTKHYDIKDYSNLSDDFIKSYKHYSTNSYNFEILCIQRWLILFDFMNKHGIEDIFVFDSDVMIYSDLNVLKIPEKYIAGFCIPAFQENYVWVASPHVSFWKITGLEIFKAFIFSCYKNNQYHDKLLEKWNYHLKNSLAGGICDMTLLYLFYEKYKDKIINFLNGTPDDFTFDHNINISENYLKNEFEHNKKHKKIFLKKKIPLCKNLLSNKNIKFHALHFNGGAKKMMPLFYTGSDFLLKMKLNWYKKRLNDFFNINAKNFLNRNKKYFNILNYIKFLKKKILENLDEK